MNKERDLERPERETVAPHNLLVRSRTCGKDMTMAQDKKEISLLKKVHACIEGEI